MPVPVRCYPEAVHVAVFRLDCNIRSNMELGARDGNGEIITTLLMKHRES
jgi:hypothetical protein